MPSEEGFTANLMPVSEESFNGSGWEEIKAAVPPNGHGSMIVCIADTATLGSADHPVLVVDLMSVEDERREPFRCIPSELWGVENNLNLANMDWNEFADATSTGSFVVSHPLRRRPRRNSVPASNISHG